MKFCKNCSAALEDDAVFCTECGASLTDDNFSANSQSGNLDGYQGTIPTPTNNSGNTYSSSNDYSVGNSYSSGSNYSSNSNYSTGNSNSQPQYSAPKGNNPGTPWLIVSIISIFCCGSLLAIPGLILSVMSTTSFNAGNLEEAASKAKTAMWLTIGAIILGVIIDILLIALAYNSSSSYTYY